LQAFLREHPSSTFSDHALYTIAYTYSLQEKHADALQAFELLTRTYPRSELVPAALYYAANAQYATGDYEDAVQRYRSLMGLYPTTFYGIEALRGLQESLSLLGRNDEAIDVGKAYVKANPDGNVQEQISMKTIEIFMRKGDYGNAAKEYQDFLKKYPDSDLSAEAMFLLAKSQMGLGDMDAARQTLTLLHSKYEQSDFASQGIMQLALLELKRANVTRADSLFDLVVKKYSATELAAQATYEQANLAMGRGDTTRALGLYAAAGQMNLGEYSHQSMYRLAMFYRSGNKDDSSRAYFRAVAVKSDNTSLAAECVYRIGESYLSLRDYSNAMTSFDEVRRSFDGIEDWYTLSLIGLGECYEKTGSTDKAREIYQTVIILHPEDDYGTTAQSRLKRLR
jgi:TolA-binding protein